MEKKCVGDRFNTMEKTRHLSGVLTEFPNAPAEISFIKNKIIFIARTS